MTGFDNIVLLIGAIAAIGGFMRGFVQEVLSLASWVLAVFAIRYLHTDFTAILFGFIGTPSGAAALALTNGYVRAVIIHGGRPETPHTVS